MNEDWDAFLKKQCDKVWESTIEELESANLHAANSKSYSGILSEVSRIPLRGDSQERCQEKETKGRARAEKIYKRWTASYSAKEAKSSDLRRAGGIILRKRIQPTGLTEVRGQEEDTRGRNT